MLRHARRELIAILLGLSVSSFLAGAYAGCLLVDPADGNLSGCPDTNVLADGDSCTATCDAGYTLQGEFVCDSSGVLTDNATCEEASCSAPSGVTEASSPSCEEGSTISPGTSCTPSCNDGFVASVSSLACALGALSPSTFECTAPKCAVPTGVANAAATVCAEGNGDIDDGGVCTTQCVENYVPSPSSLACSVGELEPRTFTCGPSGCSAPEGIENAASSPCSEGSQLAHGGACTAQCAPGYVASPSSLSCGLGTLSPATFSCVPAGCSAPEDISMAASVACTEGASIADGGSCTTTCQSGYTPSVKALSCSSGVLSPDTFTCRPKACAAPSGIEFADADPCYEGSKIAHGSSCTPHCESGYAAVPGSLTCALGSLYPASFACRSETCEAPSGIAHAASEVCAEGDGDIAHGSACTAQCEDGYTPSHSVLRCSGGTLTPRTFQCEPKSCSAPTGISQAASLPCQGASTIAHGDVCTAACAEGYTPFPSALGCGLGTLTPSTFQCVASGCAAPTDVEHAADSACSEGSSIHNGGICTTACAAGYNPSVETLACDLDALSPATFTCERTGCYAPSVSNAPSQSCEEGTLIPDGYNCTAQCKSGYVASTGTLHCKNGNFTESFACSLVAEVEESTEVVMSLPAFLIVFFLNLFVMVFLSAIVGWRCFVWGRSQGSSAYADGYNAGSFAGWLKGQQTSPTPSLSDPAQSGPGGQNGQGDDEEEKKGPQNCCARCCRRRRRDSTAESGTPDVEAGSSISIVVHPPGAEPSSASPGAATAEAAATTPAGPAQQAVGGDPDDGDGVGGSQYHGMNPFAAGSDTLDSIPDGNSPFYPKDPPLAEADPATASSADDGQSPDRRTSLTSVASASASAAAGRSEGPSQTAPTASQPAAAAAAATAAPTASSSTSPERAKKKGPKSGEKDKPRKRRSKDRDRAPTADPASGDVPPDLSGLAAAGVTSGPPGGPLGIDPNVPLDTSAME